ncbi:MAG: hypothetical protein HPY85_13440 [Anaerolineae bacterium]|nr:hypothetical protein [Anaerolineae bacterium]
MADPLESLPLLTRVKSGLRWRAVRFLNNQALRKMARQVAHAAPAANGQPVAFFNASTRLGSMSLNAAYSLLVSWSLRMEGIPAVHFVCRSGMTRCIHGTDKSHPEHKPPCAECIAQSRANFTAAESDFFDYTPDADFDRHLATLSLPEMENLELDGIPLGPICRSSLRWVMRRYHLQDTPATHQLFREYLRSGWNVARKFADFLNEHDPRALVIFNGIVYPEAIARFLAQRRGIRVVSHEVNMQPFSAYFTEGEATFRSTCLPQDFHLTPMENERFDQYFSKRTRGQFKMAGVAFWKDIQDLDSDFVRQLDQFRQVVPVFTNVIFDTSQEHANVLFENMFVWLDSVLETARQHPDTVFVLRAHPDEARPGKASEESVADWASASGFINLPNTIFIPPDQPLNSYELISRAKFTMIYTSTIGMESSLLGTPVLCAGKAYYNQYAPAAYVPQTRAQYETHLAEFLAAPAPLPVPEEHRVNARNFLYSQLYLSSLSFEAFLEEDGAWPGYVKLKDFPVETLLSRSSVPLRVIRNGILDGTPFLLPRESVM